MRQIVIDELSPMERDNIDSYLKRNLMAGPMLGIYWIKLTPDLLAGPQQGHEKCGPFYFAVEVEKNSVCFELLVRSESNLHCSCIAHASKAQRHYVLDFIDKMLEEEQIRA